MKRIFSLLLLSALVFISCEGPQGPPGFDGLDGQDGQDGGVFLAETFEVTRSFNSSNGYSSNIVLDPVIFDGDVILVYRLEDVFEGRPVWEPLPTSTIFLNDPDDTTIVYRFNFTVSEILLLLESNNPQLVPDDLALDQTFRIVIVPSEFAQKNDTSDLNKVMSTLKLTTSDFKELEL